MRVPSFPVSLIAFAAAAMSATAIDLPDIFSLSVPRTGFPQDFIWNNLMYVTNTTSFVGSAWVGNIRYDLASEPLLATGGQEIGFTSIHQALTGFTALYVFPNASLPLGFTVPHSGAVPDGAVTDGFFLTPNNTFAFQAASPEQWFACEEEFNGGADASTKTSYKIYWDGAGVLDETSGCISVPLNVVAEAGDCRLP